MLAPDSVNVPAPVLVKPPLPVMITGLVDEKTSASVAWSVRITNSAVPAAIVAAVVVEEAMVALLPPVFNRPPLPSVSVFPVVIVRLLAPLIFNVATLAVVWAVMAAVICAWVVALLIPSVAPPATGAAKFASVP